MAVLKLYMAFAILPSRSHELYGPSLARLLPLHPGHSGAADCEQQLTTFRDLLDIDFEGSTSLGGICLEA